MIIRDNENIHQVLSELGIRIKQYRISMNITQAELAEKSGISTSTEVRIENGVDSMLSNYLRILSALEMLDNVNVLVPELQPDFKSIYENKPTRKRATTKKADSKSKWVWEEDKREENK